METRAEAPQISTRSYLIRYGIIGAAIAFAGPPIYIHAPKVYAELHGVNLAILGAVLLALRAFDFVQDPLLGWGISRAGKDRTKLAMLFTLLLGAGMVMLFLPALPLPAAVWFALSLAFVFTGFSGLQIMFYTAGLGLADFLKTAHAKVAAWRETSVLFGVCAACVAPSIFAIFSGEQIGYALYAAMFAGIVLLGLIVSRPVWQTPLPQQTETANYKSLLKDKPLRWLLAIGFLNSLPTGVTSTLFLFYVDDRLEAGVHAGPMLLLFFLSAAFAAPFWGKLAEYYGGKIVLQTGMMLAIPAFILAAFLSSGDALLFYIVCVLSGITLGSDMTILPALLSERLTESGESPSHAFGMWGFITKMSFAIAAGFALPLLALSGYEPGPGNTENALLLLALTYAALPCALKVLAVICLQIAPIKTKPV